jgi:hypothetical protein
MPKPTDVLFGEIETAEHKTPSEFWMNYLMWKYSLSEDRGRDLEMTADCTGIYQSVVKTDTYVESYIVLETVFSARNNATVHCTNKCIRNKTAGVSWAQMLLYWNDRPVRKTPKQNRWQSQNVAVTG